MSTATLEKPTTALPATICADVLLDLLNGASVATGAKHDPQMTQSVYLSAKNYVFTVKATDRYRLIVGTTKAIVGIESANDGNMDEVALDSNAIKPLKLFLSSRKTSEVTLTVEDYRLTVSQLGQQVTVNSIPTHTFPDIYSLLEQVAPSLKSGIIGLDIKLLASFSKVPARDNHTKLLFNGDNKCVRIEIGHNSIAWECLLMPMRSSR